MGAPLEKALSRVNSVIVDSETSRNEIKGVTGNLEFVKGRFESFGEKLIMINNKIGNLMTVHIRSLDIQRNITLAKEKKIAEQEARRSEKLKRMYGNKIVQYLEKFMSNSKYVNVGLTEYCSAMFQTVFKESFDLYERSKFRNTFTYSPRLIYNEDHILLKPER